MELTNKQLQGLKIAIERYHNREPYTVISGYAGSGKSTLVKFIVDALELDEEEVAYCSFTGKAAQVLMNKGCPNATTAHRLLYDTRPMSDGTFMHKPKECLPYSLIIVDECSMLPASLANLLLSYRVYTIFCGDPEQLPPISKDEDNHLLDHPHIFLDEIMRQAMESDIIRCSMDIREGKRLVPFKGNDVCIVNRADVVSGMYTWADMILCATNKTRVEVNNTTRSLLGFEGDLPNEGEKIICYQNDWNKIADSGNALVNGSVGTLKSPVENTFYIPNYMEVPNNRLTVIKADFTSETNDKFGYMLMDKKMFTNGEPTLNKKQRYQMSRTKTTKALLPYEFTYGYCITGWRAQGSEWDKVLILEENFPMDRVEHRKFLYTCLTRASQKATLVLRN